MYDKEKILGALAVGVIRGALRIADTVSDIDCDDDDVLSEIKFYQAVYSDFKRAYDSIIKRGK